MTTVVMITAELFRLKGCLGYELGPVVIGPAGHERGAIMLMGSFGPYRGLDFRAPRLPQAPRPNIEASRWSDDCMNVGVVKVTLRLPENQSLKGKRRVISSLNARIRNKFQVSIAEVDYNEAWQLATLGIACVSNDSRHANEVLESVVAYIENGREEVELVTHQQEIISDF